MTIDKFSLLSATSLNILLALSLRPRHGYELLRQIEQDTQGQAKLGPGGLYTTIKKLRTDVLIEDMPFAGGERRRYYRLTKKGWDRLATEVRQYERIVRLAHERRVLDDGRG